MAVFITAIGFDNGCSLLSYNYFPGYVSYSFHLLDICEVSDYKLRCLHINLFEL